VTAPSRLTAPPGDGAAAAELEAAADSYGELGLRFDRARPCSPLGGRSAGSRSGPPRGARSEIASALFVTVNTVEGHLSHAYAKLGIRSRAQLASLARERWHPGQH